MSKKSYSKEDVTKLIHLAHKSITRTKGKEYAPDVHELQSWIDDYISKQNETDIEESNELKGGVSDGKTLMDLAKKHAYDDSTDSTSKEKIMSMFKELKSQLRKGIEVEMEHSKDESKAREIAMDHISEDPKYYDKLTKMEMDEKWSQKYKDSIDCSNPKGFSQRAHCQGRKKQDTKESMGADSAGSFEMAFNTRPIKRPITKIHNMNEEADIDEAMTADSAGAYDAPFGFGGKNPLGIGGEKSIKQSRAVKDKKFPKWGGPKGVYVRVKDKCKKFPYCNQGNTGALEFYEVDGLVETVKKVSKKYGIPYSEMEKVVLNEINKIFIR